MHQTTAVLFVREGLFKIRRVRSNITLMMRTTLKQMAEKVERGLVRHEWRWVFGCIMALLVLALAVDLRQKMWLDELYTFYTASQANPVEVVRALMEGTDGMPPAYSILVNLLLHVSPIDALAVRLPATLGYCGMVFFLYAFCRRRLTVLYAMAAAALACLLNINYINDGRCYGVALCCIAGALYSWQLAAEGQDRRRNLLLLAFFLTVMTSMHYYSVFTLLPLFAGELIRARMTRRIDLPLLLTGLGPLLILAIHYPVMQALKRLQPHYWAFALWSDIPDFYVHRLLPLPLLGLAALALIALFPGTKPRTGPENRSLRAYEWVVLVGFTLLPVLVVTLAMFTTHIFVERYVCWAVIGGALLFTGIVQSASRSGPAAGLMILAVAISVTGVYETRRLTSGGPLIRQYPSAPGDLDNLLTQLATLTYGAEPLLVEDPGLYLELAHYAQPPLQQRITYPLNEALDVKYFGNDTNTLLLRSIRARTKLRMLDDQELMKYPQFLVLAIGRSYLPKHLRAAGYTLKPVLPESVPLLFQVEAPATVGQSK